MKLQCVRCGGKISLIFSLHGVQHCEIQSSTEGPAVLLKHSPFVSFFNEV